MCLFGLLQKLLTQCDTKAEVKEMRAVFILSLIFHSRFVKKSNSLQMQLGLHLHAGGVQRRIIDFYSHGLDSMITAISGNEGQCLGENGEFHSEVLLGRDRHSNFVCKDLRRMRLRNRYNAIIKFLIAPLEKC
jgi:hypothetical protein